MILDIITFITIFKDYFSINYLKSDDFWLIIFDYYQIFLLKRQKYLSTN